MSPVFWVAVMNIQCSLLHSKAERDRDGRSEREPHTSYSNASFWSFGVAAIFEDSRKQLAFFQSEQWRKCKCPRREKQNLLEHKIYEFCSCWWRNTAFIHRFWHTILMYSFLYPLFPGPIYFHLNYFLITCSKITVLTHISDLTNSNHFNHVYRSAGRVGDNCMFSPAMPSSLVYFDCVFSGTTENTYKFT